MIFPFEWGHTPLDLLARRYLREDARKRRIQARRRWDRENMRTVSVRVYEDTLDAFRRLCGERGLTVYGALRRYIVACVDSNMLL